MTNLRTRLIYIAVATVILSLMIFAMGESPLAVAKVLLDSAFGSIENVEYTLFYLTPLLFTGLAVLIPLEGGLFNVGAEGQLYAGAIGAILSALFLQTYFPDCPSILGLGAGFLAAFICGGIWGGIAGWLRAFFEIHEVITTIMLNFIVYAFSNWLILNVIKNPETQNVESLGIPNQFRLPLLHHHIPHMLFAGLALTFFTFWAIDRKWAGFRLRCVGQNPEASRWAGIDVKKTQVFSLIIGGGLAGLVGFHEVFGHAHRLIDGFSPQYGFTGLAIAIIGIRKSSVKKSNFFMKALPFLIMAILFAALQKGTLDLDLETENMTRDFCLVIQGIILLVWSI